MAEFNATQAADMRDWASTLSRSSRPEDLERRILLLRGAFLAIGQEAQAAPLIQIARDIAAAQAGPK